MPRRFYMPVDRGMLRPFDRLPIHHMTDLDLSIVVPVFNEAESLPTLQRELVEALQPIDVDFEVLYVDDGSTDGSLQVMRSLAGSDPRIRVVHLRRNAGQSAALAAGFRLARGDAIATLDADLQNDPADLPRLLEGLGSYDIINGIRTQRQDSWIRQIASRIANGVRNRLTRETVVDVGCSLRVFRHQLLRDLPMFTGMHRFLPTLLRLQGGSLRQIPVRHRPRLHGKSNYGIHDRLWVGIADLFAVRWMQRRWIDRDLATEIRAEEVAERRQVSP